MRYFIQAIGAAGVVAVGIFAMPVNAAVTRTVSDWQSTIGGTFSDSGNWDNGVPGDGTGAGSNTAYFGLSNTYTVLFSGDTANYETDVEAGNVTLDLANHAYTVNTDSGSRFFVGRDANDSATLKVMNGALSTYSTTIGNQSSTNAEVTLSNATWSVAAAGAMIVGNKGYGSFTVDSDAGGSSGSFQIGNVASGGTVSIQGNWNNTKDLLVGQLGPGALKILDGGSVTSKNVYASNTATAAGSEIVISGTTASLAASGEIAVGGKHEATAAATLSVGDRVVDNLARTGGKVTSPTLTIWNTGTVNLSGNAELGDSTKSIAFTVYGGALNVSGTNNVITGNATLDSSTGAPTTTITLNTGSDAGVILNVTGNLTTSGTLDVELGDIQLTSNSTFNLFDWAGQGTGSTPATSLLSFSGVTLQNPGHGWTWDQSKLNSEGIIRIAVPEPGMAALLGIGAMGLVLKRRRRA